MPWSTGIPLSLSWLRPTYYAGAEIHGYHVEFRDIISLLVQSAKDLGAKPILHTYVLAFGLVFRELSAGVDQFHNQAGIPPLGRFSSRSPEDLSFAIAELEDLLKWADHPVYAVQGQQRIKSTEKGQEQAEGSKPRGQK